MTTYLEQAQEYERQAEFLIEKATLLKRLYEIEENQNGVVKKPVAAVKKPEAPQVVSVQGGEPQKRGRGRPKGSKNKKPPTQEDGKKADLTTVLETIGQQAKGPLDLAAFVKLIHESGYKTKAKAKTFSQMVYKALLAMSKNGIFEKNDQTRQYTYKGKAA